MSRRSACSAGRRWSTTSRRCTGCASWWKRAATGSRRRARNGRKGLRSFSVSGRVKNPGVKLAPAGITIQELIDEHCGGMLDGHDVLWLPAGRRLGRHPAGVDERHSARLRHAAAVRLLHRLGGGRSCCRTRTRATDAARNMMRFFKDESCGQCTPCRNGTAKALGVDRAAEVGSRPAGGSVARDARRVDLRPRPGRAEPDRLRRQVFPRGAETHHERDHPKRSSRCSTRRPCARTQRPAVEAAPTRRS